MVKKTKNIKFDVNKEIIVKTSLKQKLIANLISSVFDICIIYICLTYFNEEILSILNIANHSSAINIVLIVLPILLIIKFMITMGQYVVSESEK